LLLFIFYIFCVWLQDAHTDSEGRLRVDKQQDYILDRIFVNGDEDLVMDFHRAYDTCDIDDYLIDVSEFIVNFGVG